MPDELDVVIDVEAEAPVATDPKPDATEAKPSTEAKPVKAADDPIEDLKSQLQTFKDNAAAEKTAREQAQAQANAERQRADTAIAERDHVRTIAVESDLSAVESAMDAAKAESESASNEWEQAQSTGDFAKSKEAQKKVARAEARMVRLEEAKGDIIERRKAPPTERRETAPQQPANEFERTISAASPRTQAWLRSHPEYVTDRTKNLKANAAHSNALAEGLAPDTDAYFDYCERQLGLKEDPKPNGNGVNSEAKPAQVRGKTMVSAPVTRETISLSGNLTATQVQLSPGEQRVATDGTITWNYDDPKVGAKKGEPIGMREYARRKLELTKQGAYDRSNTDQ